MHTRILIFLLIVSANFSIVNASDLPLSRTSSYYKYIYQLKSKEARSIYKNGLAEVDGSYFHHLIDSVPNDSVFNTKLPQGNYLMVWAQENELKFEMRSYSDLELMVHNNYADLFLTLTDTSGVEIKDAKVKINGTTVRYKPELNAYQKHKTNKLGWLEVTHKGFTSYYYLGNNVDKGVKTRKVTSSVPVKYIYVPVRLLVYLPYDLLRSIYKLRPYGIFYYIYKPFRDVYYSIFTYGTTGWVRGVEEKWEKTLYKNYDGYWVYSKPKYKPNDTVRFKSFITYENGKPIKLQPLKVEIRVDNKDLLLDTIYPNRKGSYDYEFALHDSLNLKLDKTYNINLERMNGWEGVMRKSFKYEDYELNSIKYSLRTDGMNQIRNQPYYVHVRGEDMNGLNVPDGRVNLTLLSNKSYSNIYADRVFLKDTLYTASQKLDAVGETSILIPDSVLPALDFTYDIKAVFLTSDNERVEKSSHVNYYFDRKEIKLDVANDSLKIKYEVLGKNVTGKGELIAYDKNGNQIETASVQLPCSYPVNYIASAYSIKTGKTEQYFSMSKFAPGLSVSSSRTSRKVQILVNNPKGIWFNYFIYKNDKEIAKGYAQHLDTIIHPGNTKGCFVSINYKWGGKAYDKSYSIPLYKKRLNVALKQPQLIFPGQTANIEVEVRDYKNRPVKGVDLTVFGMTKKFGYTPPSLPNYSKSQKARTMFADYYSKGDNMFGSQGQLVLDYNRWKLDMSLDTISYYRFTRPENGIHLERINVTDSVTQFAPFVYKNGRQQKVHFIYLDYALQYASVSTNEQPYSFVAKDGYHRLRLRTDVEDIIIDSVYFRKGVKTLISVDTDKSNKNVFSKEVDRNLTKEEQRLIETMFAKFDLTYNHGLTYLKQKGKLYLLNGTHNRTGYYRSAKSNIVVGPLYTRPAHFITMGRYDKMFDFEASYLYTINSRSIKMKTSDKFWNHESLTNFGSNKAFADEVITLSKLKKRNVKLSTQSVQNRIQYNNAYVTTKGNGTIGLCYNGFSEEEETEIMNVLLFKDDSPNFMQLYPGNISRLHNVSPGSYRLFFMMTNGSYFEEKQVIVKANIISALRIAEPVTFLQDSMSVMVNNLIKNKWVSYSYRHEDYNKKWETENEIKSVFQKSQLDYSNPRTISGNIVDEDGLGIPGVNVMIEGTSIGTISEFDGNYSIEIPAGAWTLHYAFIGYQTVEVPVGYSNVINVELSAETELLEDVVVVGYGMQKKKSVVGSVVSTKGEELLHAGSVTTVSEALTGLLPGVTTMKAAGQPGASANIMIRGRSSWSSNPPLYLIDGVAVEAGDFSKIDPNAIQSISVLKDASATAIYGVKAANGVILISTKPGINLTELLPGVKQENNLDVLTQVNSSNSIRSNFSDEAYWQPNLVTDKDGKASFTTTFPDDITSWSTYALAMSSNKQTGQVQHEVKSFIPVSAELKLPRFLVQGDSISAIGKMQNYTGDTIDIRSNYKIDSLEIIKEQKRIGQLSIDSLPVVVEGVDSLQFSYTLKRENGYFDGEERKVPVFAQGTMDVKGAFFTMNTDTLIRIDLPGKCTNGKLYLESSPIKILLKESYRLRNYKHLCNEQASSKLISLLNEEKICKHLGVEFKYKSDIDKLIKRLQESRSEDDLWGWWAKMPTRWWITAHVVKALEKAKEAGYSVSYDKHRAMYALVNRYEELRPHTQLDLLKTFEEMNTSVNLKKMVQEFNDSSISRVDSMELILLKQKLKLPVDIKPQLKHKKETLYGNYFWGTPCWSLFYGDIKETTLMYKILKNDGGYADYLPKIRNYFFEKRGKNGWRNTYESTLIVDLMLPDLLEIQEGKEERRLTIEIDGQKEEVKTYPYEVELTGVKQIALNKKGKDVVFAGWHSKFFNPMPEREDKYFEIHTSFEKNGDKIAELVAGEKVTLVVDIDVKKESKFLMLEIPIPSVCSYHNKSQSWWGREHREYHKEKVSIYYESLPAGKKQIKIELVPRYTGKIVLNPAFMEHMYFPVFHGNNEVKKVKVENSDM